MEGVKQVPALFRSKVDASDECSIQKITTLKEGWIIKSDFEKLVGVTTVKVFPSKSAAKASASGEEVIKIDLNWKI